MLKKMAENKKLHYGVLTAVLLLAAALRITGSWWGMPRGDMHPDEGIVYYESYNCALDRHFETKIYYRPNHVSIKLNTLLYIGIQELYFNLKGETDFAQNFNSHIEIFLTASRILTALLGVGCVVFAYLIILPFGKNRALFAAVLFALFPSFIMHSHYITPDIPLLFFMMGTLFFAVRYLKKPSVTMLFWMSMFTSLAICEKYPGAFGCLIIAFAVVLTHLKKPVRIILHGLLAIFFVVLGIMIVSPVILIDLRQVINVIEGQNHAYHLGADGLNFGQTLVYYLKTTGTGIGLIPVFCGLFGIYVSFKKDFKYALLLTTFLIYLLPISKLSVHWERYTLPLYAAGLMFAAIGVFGLSDVLKKLPVIRSGKPAALSVIKILYLVIFILPMISLLSGSIAVCGSFLAPDSRTALMDHFIGAGITDSNTIYDCNTPLSPGGYFGAWSEFENCDPSTPKYGNNPQYVVTSSAQRDLYLISDPDIYGWIADFYRRLDSDYELVEVNTVEIPESHFLEVSNLFHSIRSIYRYAKGAMSGYEIRVYRLW
ncbi:MAG: phospholipid carrier-dependent glycosyltransferase [Lachnospiraceae bacterium]|nr:phospholipid carrier-dependent glycosyltransferase [Lachnospiraceae bacterium]